MIRNAARWASVQSLSSTPPIPLLLGWTRLWWADGPNTQALGLVQGDSSFYWPDEVIGQNFQSFGFEYNAAATQTNGRPSMRLNSTNTNKVNFGLSIPRPYSIIIVAYTPSVSTAHYITDGFDGSSRVIIGSPNFSAKYSFFAGTHVQSAQAPTVGLKTFHAFNPASGLGTMKVNGDQVLAGLPGTNAVTGLSLNGAYDSFVGGGGHSYYAMIGYYPGDIREDPNWPDFVDWALAEYGVVLGAVASDNFNRANATSLGTASGGLVWNNYGIRDFAISNNQAVLGSGASTGSQYVNTLPFGSADGTISVILGGTSANGNAGVAWRVLDNLNFLRVVYDSGRIYIDRRSSGTFIGIADFAHTLTGADEIKAIFSGDALEVLVNGVSKYAGTQTFNQTETSHGIAFSTGGSSSAVGYTLDDLTFVPA